MTIKHNTARTPQGIRRSRRRKPTNQNRLEKELSYEESQPILNP